MRVRRGPRHCDRGASPIEATGPGAWEGGGSGDPGARRLAARQIPRGMGDAGGRHAARQSWSADLPPSAARPRRARSLPRGARAAPGGRRDAGAPAAARRSGDERAARRDRRARRARQRDRRAHLAGQRPGPRPGRRRPRRARPVARRRRAAALAGARARAQRALPARSPAVHPRARLPADADRVRARSRAVRRRRAGRPARARSASSWRTGAAPCVGSPTTSRSRRRRRGTRRCSSTVSTAACGRRGPKRSPRLALRAARAFLAAVRECGGRAWSVRELPGGAAEVLARLDGADGVAGAADHVSWPSAPPPALPPGRALAARRRASPSPRSRRSGACPRPGCARWPSSRPRSASRRGAR